LRDIVPAGQMVSDVRLCTLLSWWHGPLRVITAAGPAGARPRRRSGTRLLDFEGLHRTLSRPQYLQYMRPTAPDQGPYRPQEMAAFPPSRQRIRTFSAEHRRYLLDPGRHGPHARGSPRTTLPVLVAAKRETVTPLSLCGAAGMVRTARAFPPWAGLTAGGGERRNEVVRGRNPGFQRKPVDRLPLAADLVRAFRSIDRP